MPSRVGLYNLETPGQVDTRVAEQDARRLTLQSAVEQRKAQIEAARQKAEQDAFIRDTVGRHVVNGRPDMDAVIADLYKAYPDRARAFEEEELTRRSKLAEMRHRDATTERLNMEVDTALLGRIVDDGTFEVFSSRLSPELQKVFGGKFDPKLRDQLLQKAPDEINRLKMVGELIGKSPRESLLLDLAGADSPEEWAATWQGYSQLGLKPSEIEAFQQLYGAEFSPEGLARVQAAVTKPETERSPTSDYSRFLGRYAESIGKTAETLTAADELKAKEAYGRADDRPVQTAGQSGLSPSMESNVLNRLTNQWATAKKPAEELHRQAELMRVGMDQARQGNLNAGSQAVIATFNKILDPTSVVRESEYDRTAAGQSLITRVKGAFERLKSGGAGVPLPELEKFYALAQEAVKAQTGAYLQSTRERIGRTADRYRIPRDIVFEDVDVTTGRNPVAEPPKNLDVPEAVRNTLASKGDGQFKLSDGTTWEKRGGVIKQIK